MFMGMIIRPPRAEYVEPPAKEMDYAGKTYKMENFEVFNEHGERLSCSFSEPKNDADRSGPDMPCVIYMHGNASCKLEG